jgi:hypothetical protein
MPFFPQDQIQRVINGLSEKSDKRFRNNPIVAEYIQAVSSALSEFDQWVGENGNETKKADTEYIKYLGDADLNENGGLIAFLERYLISCQQNQQNFSSKSIQEHIYNNFLVPYKKGLRNDPLFEQELEKTFTHYFCVAWHKRRDRCPSDQISKIVFEEVKNFLYSSRRNITEIYGNNFISPIAKTACDLFIQSIITILPSDLENYAFEQNPRPEPLTQDITNITNSFKQVFHPYLTKNILPNLQKISGEVVIALDDKASLDIRSTDLLYGETIDEIIKFLSTQLFPKGLPPNCVTTKASSLQRVEEEEKQFGQSAFQNHLTDAFNKLPKDGTVYVPLDRGGHWVFLSIQKTTPQTSTDPIVLTIRYIDSLSECNSKVIPEASNILKKIFPTATIKSEAIARKIQMDGYTCGDRTMAEIFNAILEQSQIKDAAKNNPWPRTSNPFSVRSATLALLDTIKNEGKPAPYNHGKKLPRSWFDQHPLTLALVLLLIVIGIVTGGFGIGVLAGSTIAANVFFIVFQVVAGPALQNAALYAVILGLGGALSLLVFSGQGFSNAWDRISAWWNAHTVLPQPAPTTQIPTTQIPTQQPQAQQETTQANTTTATATNLSSVSQPNSNSSNGSAAPTTTPAPITTTNSSPLSQPNTSTSTALPIISSQNPAPTPQ